MYSVLYGLSVLRARVDAFQIGEKLPVGSAFPSTCPSVHRVLYEQARRHAGRPACPSVVIMDGQSVKTTERGGMCCKLDPYPRVLPGLKVMVDRATRWKLQQSPLAACPQEVKDGVEDGTKVGGARSPARTSRRQNRGNPGPCRVGEVGVVESSAHRSLWPGSALFQDRRELFKHPLRKRDFDGGFGGIA
jgi:hypothetical protein